MNRPVGDIDFWKGRIEEAKRGYEHYSVYVANPKLWNWILRNHMDLVNRLILPTDKVLDAGCGYGRASEFLPGDYTGVDFSPDFLAKAHDKYPDRVFIRSTLDATPFKDKQFDWAVCISIRAMIKGNLGAEAWNAMEKELKRVAKQVLILEYEDPTEYWIL